MEARRPEPEEYNEYYHNYVRLVPAGDIIDILERQRRSTLELLEGIDESRGDYRYAAGKWTLKEVVGHVIDVEWVFTYRGLRIARGDPTPMPGIEQDDLVRGAEFGSRRLADLARELSHLRSANIALFRSWSPEVLRRVGTASGFRFSARSIPYIIAGHELHHRGVIEERYLA